MFPWLMSKSQSQTLTLLELPAKCKILSLIIQSNILKPNQMSFPLKNVAEISVVYHHITLTELMDLILTLTQSASSMNHLRSVVVIKDSILYRQLEIHQLLRSTRMKFRVI